MVLTGVAALIVLTAAGAAGEAMRLREAVAAYAVSGGGRARAELATSPG